MLRRATKSDKGNNLDMLELTGDFNARIANNKAEGNADTFQEIICNNGRLQILLYPIL
jgi:hypothetical protein